MSLKHVVLFLLSMIVSSVKAQNADSVFINLSKKLGLDDMRNPSSLFLHFDKTVYSANEQAWFAAYLTHTSDFSSHHTLNVVLFNEMDQTVATAQKFSLENGLATGSFSIPDSLQSGDYVLAAYTNKILDEKNLYIFRQPVHILGLRKDPFLINITGSREGENIVIHAQISKANKELAIQAKISLSVWENGKEIKKVDERTNNSGQIGFSLPAITGVNYLEIAGSVIEGKDHMIFKKPLTWFSRENFIRFFPQGGKVQAGRLTQIAIKLKNTSGKNLSKNCVMLENGNELASFSTDIYGNGIFNIIPKIGKSYIIKIKGDSEVPVQQFPPVAQKSWTIQPLAPIVSDTLRLLISSPDMPGNCKIAIYNSKALLYGALLKLKNAEAVIRVPVKDWEQGLITIKLFSNDGVLQDNRMVMVKGNEKLNALLKADSVSYKPLSKVTAKLILTDSKGVPLKGVFSFSCVLEQALSAEAGNIVGYNQFAGSLPDRVVLPPWLFVKNNANIIYTLLRQENTFIDKTTLTGIKGQANGGYDGQVVYNDKALKKAVEIMVSGSQTAFFSTSANGTFTIPYEPLRGEAGKKVFLTVIAKRPYGYKIQLGSSLDEVNTLLANQHLLRSEFNMDELSVEEKRLLASNRNILLNDVIVKGKNTDNRDYYGKPNTGGVCLDYVCQFDVLNCPYHTGVKSAEDGHIYNIETPTGIKQTVYHCEFRTPPAYIRVVPATIISTQYQPFKPSDPNLPAAMNNTTLHWQAFLSTDQNGEAIVSFFTNSRRGRFKLSVQGITNTEVFSEETMIEVK